MDEKGINWCTCEGHDAKKWRDMVAFYTKHFIPETWELEYGTLNREKGRCLYMTGVCSSCGNFMRSGVGLSMDGGDRFLENVYREMEHFRPYDNCDEDSKIYHGCVAQRSKWYQWQDSLTLRERNQQFLNLFRVEDQAAAEEWLTRSHPAEPAEGHGTSGGKLNLPYEKYEPVTSRPVELDALGVEVTLDVFDIYGSHEIKTCYGDICKIVNALRDYCKLLEMVCDDWNLVGFHRASYELQAETLREIAGKFQAGIGYDYDAAIAKCQKKRGKKPRNEDVGGEALAMGYLKGKQMAAAKAKKAAEGKVHEQPSEPDEPDMDFPWKDDAD